MEGDAIMTRTISVTNEHVINTLNNATNASELITIAVLYYLGNLDSDYIETYKMLQNATNRLRKEREL